jgi:N6-L-threonylcarbamoyladenine synthase
MLFLGIETSCDETSAAVVESGKRILSNVVLSQVDRHKIFGGIVPEIAARLHVEASLPVINQALKEAKIRNIKDIDAIGVVHGPGLCGSLLVGISCAKALAYTLNIPLIGVNHLQAHIYAVSFCYEEVILPAIALVVSGGHTCLGLVKNFDDYQLLGETLDDAAGEAYDKVAKMLNLGYPGGPIIDNLIKDMDSNKKPIKFPRAYLFSRPYDFSFSGLKTAVLYYIKKHKNYDIESVVKGFQDAIIEVLVKKSIKAAKKFKVKSVIVAGGVSANSQLREKFKEATQAKGLNLYYPSLQLCTDNAAMVAGLAYIKYKNKKLKDLYQLDAQPDLSLKED